MLRPLINPCPKLGRSELPARFSTSLTCSLTDFTPGVGKSPHKAADAHCPSLLQVLLLLDHTESQVCTLFYVIQHSVIQDYLTYLEKSSKVYL